MESLCATGTVFSPGAPCGRVRILALLLLASALAPGALAQEPCEETHEEIDPVEGSHIGADLTLRECGDARAWEIGVSEPEGRSTLVWYDDESGTGIGLFHPPRFVWWHEDAYGCMMVVYLAGAIEEPCRFGSPPPPPALP